ncbi:hypothetical protein B296_00036212, partial [Ensete ventricosum]
EVSSASTPVAPIVVTIAIVHGTGAVTSSSPSVSTVESSTPSRKPVLLNLEFKHPPAWFPFAHYIPAAAQPLVFFDPLIASKKAVVAHPVGLPGLRDLRRLCVASRTHHFSPVWSASATSALTKSSSTESSYVFLCLDRERRRGHLFLAGPLLSATESDLWPTALSPPDLDLTYRSLGLLYPFPPLSLLPHPSHPAFITTALPLSPLPSRFQSAA